MNNTDIDVFILIGESHFLSASRYAWSWHLNLSNMPFTDSRKDQCSKAACSQILFGGLVDGCFCFTISTADEDVV